MQNELHTHTNDNTFCLSLTACAAQYAAVCKRWQTKSDFDYSIAVLPITVAALMTPKWLLGKLQVPVNVTRCHRAWGSRIRHSKSCHLAWHCPVDCGSSPDIRNLAEFFGKNAKIHVDLDKYTIEILAEINHVPATHRTCRKLLIPNSSSMRTSSI